MCGRGLKYSKILGGKEELSKVIGFYEALFIVHLGDVC